MNVDYKVGTSFGSMLNVKFRDSDNYIEKNEKRFLSLDITMEVFRDIEVKRRRRRRPAVETFNNW